MRNTILGAAALAAAVAFSGAAFAGDHGPSLQERQQQQQNSVLNHQTSVGYSGASSSYSRPDSFTIVSVAELTKGQRGHIKAAATPANLEALHASIDASTAAELRAHGVQINNIIGSTTAFNGRTVFYVQ
jgi:hypothetical protein